MKKIKKKTPKPVVHEQWVEISVKDGKTISAFYPPNDEFERLRLERDPPPALIYRRLNFINGVPPEYMWTQPTLTVKTYGGCFLHRISVADWLAVYRQEKMLANGPVIPAEEGLCRPAAYGPCSCGLCTRERELKWAAE